MHLSLSLVSEFWFLVIVGDTVETVSGGLETGLGPLPDGRTRVGRNWWEALGLDDPVAARSWHAVQTQRGTTGRVHHARAGGGVRWLRLLARGEPVDGKWILSAEEVTEEREESERARLEAEHFHALIERSSEGISMFDKTSKILYESPSNKRIHGYEPEEMEGRTLMSFCHPDDMARIALRFKHLAEAPGVVETEIVRFRHKQGHYIYLEGTVLNATDDPRLGAMVNNFREVTGRLEAERELRRAKTAAEEAQRLQQHFLTNLSHEFKTPLTLIRGPLETLVADAGMSARNRQTLGLMFRNVERLDALLTELVDLARLEAGAFALKVRRHGLAAFLRAQVDAFAGLAKEKGIGLRMEAEGEQEVFFDVVKLEKVVGNLVGNALKFSPSGTLVRVSLYLRPSADGAGQAEVAVSDQGPGMDEETRARVFERFYQGDAGLARGHEGMGIGLAIAREMVELHGGALTVESEPGLGTTFSFTLPLGCEHLDPDDIDLAGEVEARPHSIGAGVLLPLYAPDHDEEGEAGEEGGLNGERGRERPTLLLVEDNLDMRAFLRLHLDLHYRVTEAENGEAALAVLEQVTPDIVLSDVMMPRLNGLELCRRMRADARWVKIPVLLLSAKGAVDQRLEGLKAGADDYLAKPFSVPELLHRLRARLPQRPTGEDTWAERLEACADARLGEPGFDVEALAHAIGYSPRQLRRRVAECFGVSPALWLLGRRMARAKVLMDARKFETRAEVAHAVGLSPGYFSRRFRQVGPQGAPDGRFEAGDQIVRDEGSFI